MRLSVMRIDGHVPSPTPMVGMSGDSTRTTWTLAAPSPRCSAAMALAVIQPAVPPPTITTFVVGRFITTSSRDSLKVMRRAMETKASILRKAARARSLPAPRAQAPGQNLYLKPRL